MEEPTSIGGKWLEKSIAPNKNEALSKTTSRATTDDESSVSSATSSTFVEAIKVVSVDPNQLRFSAPKDLVQSPGTSAFHLFRAKPKTTSEDDMKATDNKELQNALKDPTKHPSQQQKDSLFRKISQRNLSIGSMNMADSGKVKRSPPFSKGAPNAKLGSRSTSTTRTTSGGEFTSSTRSKSNKTTAFKSTNKTASRQPHDDLSVVSDETPNISRRKYGTAGSKLPSSRRSSGQESLEGSLRQAPSLGSSTWAPADEIWGHHVSSVSEQEDDSKVRRDNAPALQKQKSTRHKKKHSKSNRHITGDSSPTKKGLMKLDPPPISLDERSKHIRKTQRRSKSERSVTQDSPNSQSSNERMERTLSTRDEFRAFLVHDRVTQSQRNLMDAHRKSAFSKKKDRKRKKKTKSPPRTTGNRNRGSIRVPEATEKMPTITPNAGEETRRPRILMQTQASMSTIDMSRSHHPSVSPDDVGPALHSFFDWTRSPRPTEEFMAEEPLRTLHRAPSSRGIVDRRKLLRKSHSTSDVHQYHLTPEWPGPKRNGRLHSMFYDLSLRRHDGHATASPGIRTISARQMLSIMEPCSRREIMTAQGLDLEPPLCRDDDLFNYGEVLDTISLTSSNMTKASSQQVSA